ncbi:hypothetical protein BO85DRAFT_451654 [Aspergillus piperis CBS 112811]|uniref:Uncharacterized protein n=1 Tax=Aspergillus piperis CBS 112811 TaxID=1448313 RepID=A0A8G1VKI6_9EURO|nr:hypothetical protein BO85DRAFT_451654 [Aspergillus piperis CBS 112811]RAH55342.1 hypothetical protein BO85DRAFT_451654 [Aspergillus piperis CBS 112811]
MIVANGSPSGTPGNNPDLNSELASYLIQGQCCLVSADSHLFLHLTVFVRTSESLVQCRLTKSQDNASVPMETRAR